MSNKLKKELTIIFDQDIQENDCEYIINTIRMIKGIDLVEHTTCSTQDEIDDQLNDVLDSL